jgi:hypothetical protein
MHKKEISKSKKPPQDEKVNNLYGVHFEYNDLFSRLVKVQKQRQQSDDKNILKKISSVDHKFHQTTKLKKDSLLRKRSSSGSSIKCSKRSDSLKKILIRFPVIDMKNEIFKSFSPNRKIRKKPSKVLMKKSEKKSESTLRIVRKSPSKLK